MNIREAQAADIARLAEIELSGDVRWGAGGLEHALGDSNVLLLVAEDENGKIAGFIVALVVADEMQVQNIVVDNAFRRLGIGTFLLKSATEIAISAGATEVFLEVAADNNSAIALYEKSGFLRTGIRPKFYSSGADAIIMHNKPHLIV